MTNQYNESSYPIDAGTRSLHEGGGAPAQGGLFGGGPSIYPGLGGNPYGFQQPPSLPVAPSGNGGAGGGQAGGGLLGNFNIAQLKTMLDRMGGIDGVLSTMTKVQKVVSTFQQMAPMMKLMLGAFGGKASTKNAGFDIPPPVYRKRRKKRRGAGRPGSGRRGSGRTRR
ncbi:aminotransferase [Paenibacillus chartarius]|uniref:Aminotransferase n=1 Tax=Paenibacillus chartarius TaxID=747481 RepID=A0ABV6DL65_9BACL